MPRLLVFLGARDAVTEQLTISQAEAAAGLGVCIKTLRGAVTEGKLR